MRNLNHLNQWRVPHPFGGMGDEKNGAFIIPLAINKTKVILKVIASNGEGWEHVSVSTDERCPTWDEMQKIKELFFEDHEVVMQLHPAKSNYVNIHPYCLHLWRPIDKEIPLPDIYLV